MNPQDTNLDNISFDGSTLICDGLTNDVYETVILAGSNNATTPFWLAHPINAAPPDKYLPSGNIHAKFREERIDLLHVTGRIYDALGAGLYDDPHGAAGYYIIVDGEKSDIVLSDNGNFSIDVNIVPNEKGIHKVTLYAADLVHLDPVIVDEEFVSEHRMKFTDIISPDPNDWSNVLGCVLMHASCPYPCEYAFDDVDLHLTAIAKPRLDDKGLLVFDGSETLHADNYKWTAENVLTGEIITLDNKEVVNTEEIEAGLYLVTLDVGQSMWNILYPPPPPANLTNFSSSTAIVPEDFVNNTEESEKDSFFIVIPPRVSLNARKITGSIHVRWTSEKREDGYVWVLLVSGYVFDEIGTSVYGYDATDLTAWVEINGEEIDLSLDAAGRFSAYVLIGAEVEDKYAIKLLASSHYLSADDIDLLELEYLYIFQPEIK